MAVLTVLCLDLSIGCELIIDYQINRKDISFVSYLFDAYWSITMNIAT